MLQRHDVQTAESYARSKKNFTNAISAVSRTLGFFHSKLFTRSRCSIL